MALEKWLPGRLKKLQEKKNIYLIFHLETEV